MNKLLQALEEELTYDEVVNILKSLSRTTDYSKVTKLCFYAKSESKAIEELREKYLILEL